MMPYVYLLLRPDHNGEFYYSTEELSSESAVDLPPSF